MFEEVRSVIVAICNCNFAEADSSDSMTLGHYEKNTY